MPSLSLCSSNLISLLMVQYSGHSASLFQLSTLDKRDNSHITGQSVGSLRFSPWASKLVSNSRKWLLENTTRAQSVFYEPALNSPNDLHIISSLEKITDFRAKGKSYDFCWLQKRFCVTPKSENCLDLLMSQKYSLWNIYIYIYSLHVLEFVNSYILLFNILIGLATYCVPISAK